MGSYDDELGAHLRRLGCNNERIARELERQREERLLYSDANGDPVLKESYVAYLDALGTRARVGALDDLGLRQELLLRRYRWFLHDEEWQKGYQRFLAFTDNVVIGTPVTTDTYGEPAFVLGQLLGSVGAYQMNVTARGTVLRGGVERGPLYIDGGSATGSALVDAATLEHEIAVYPRIILSQSCTEMVMGLREDWGWDGILLVDADGLVFVNYLKVIDADEMPGEVEDGLKAHRAVVETGLDKFVKPGREREKYRWAAHYHNYVAVEFFQRDDQVITEKLTALESEFPRQFRRLP